MKSWHFQFLLIGLAISAIGLGIRYQGSRLNAERAPFTSQPRALPRAAPRAAPTKVASKVASYELTASLDPDKKQVSGKGKLHWRNTSDIVVSEIYLHLYLNAFKNEDSRFLRSVFSTGRDGKGATDFGYIQVKRFTLPSFSKQDLWPRAAPHSPDDPKDETDIRLPLPQAIEPGQQVTFEFEFEARLPRLIARTGYEDTFFLVAQWFPKIARLEPSGRWEHFAFHPNAEFYADFGDYRVELNVPKRFIVGACGKLRRRQERGDRNVYVYEAKNVHDFAWTAWPEFQIATRRIAGVEVRLLYPPGHTKNVQTTFRSLSYALPSLQSTLRPLRS